MVDDRPGEKLCRASLGGMSRCCGRPDRRRNRLGVAGWRAWTSGVPRGESPGSPDPGGQRTIHDFGFVRKTIGASVRSSLNTASALAFGLGPENPMSAEGRCRSIDRLVSLRWGLRWPLSSRPVRSRRPCDSSVGSPSITSVRREQSSSPARGDRPRWQAAGRGPPDLREPPLRTDHPAADEASGSSVAVITRSGSRGGPRGTRPPATDDAEAGRPHVTRGRNGTRSAAEGSGHARRAVGRGRRHLRGVAGAATWRPGVRWRWRVDFAERQPS